MLDRAPMAVDCDEDTGFDPLYAYAETLDLVERLYHLRLDVIRDELRRLGVAGIAPGQALLVFRIGSRELTATELMQRGCYHGSNVSYTLRKLIDGGFLRQRTHTTDARSVLVSLTQRGTEMRDLIAGLFERHAEEIDIGGRLGHRQLEALVSALRSLERFWAEQRLQERWEPSRALPG